MAVSSKSGIFKLRFLQKSYVRKLSEVTTPIKRYNELLQDGLLKPDRCQFLAMLKLQELYNDLQEYNQTQTSIQDKKISDKDKGCDNASPQKGLYLHGEVGTGKTMLLDIFYDALNTKEKKRVHFNSFMLYLYSEQNRWGLSYEGNGNDSDFLSPTQYIADNMMKDAWLLCLDEIQVSDYASYTLLDGVLSRMIDNGAIIVGTSNRSPAELGESNISGNNDEIETKKPSYFQGLFMNHCHIHHLDSKQDHREILAPGELRYLQPCSTDNEEKMDRMFADVIFTHNNINNPKVTSSLLEIYNRKIYIPLCSGNTARFTFKELCCKPLGSADYTLICSTYSHIFIDNIPKLNIRERNEARRLLTFIDAAYECRVKLYCTAETSWKDIFLMLPRDDENYTAEQMHLEMIGEIAYDLKLAGLDFKSLNILSGEDEIFSFRRAISRLVEMQSQYYQSTKHRPQFFFPYLGTEQEKQEKENRRILREKKRIQAEMRKNEEEQLELMQGVANIRSRQMNAPRFNNEQHFWGFGWWEKVKEKLGSKKPDDNENL